VLFRSLDTPCAESHRLHGYQPRCPELAWDPSAGRYVCLLMQDPARGPAFRASLGAGRGCCAPLNPWRKDVRNRDE